jgi:RHS repeat-associated protein
LTDETGALTDTYAFTAFGELHTHTGTDPNAFLFAGEMLDPNSGFYYLRARWMDPGVGRFASLDSFGGLAFEPLTIHKYLYAGANPANHTDPSGLFFGGGFSGAISGAIINVGLRISSIGAAGYSYLYVVRNLRALNWTLNALRAIQTRFGNLHVTLEEVLVRSRGSIDLVLRRSAGSGQRISIELKNWSFDSIARSQERAAGLLQQIQRQAQNFRANQLQAIFSFAEGASTQRGQVFMNQVRTVLVENGHKVTIGTQSLLDEVARHL